MKRILFVMEWYSNEVHRGIAKYAGEHGWHLNSQMVIDGRIPTMWDGDGILTASAVEFPRIRPLIETTRAQVVYFSTHTTDAYQPSICLDHRKIAKLAAEHLLGKGHRRFVCYGKDNHPSTLRMSFFEEEIKKKDGTVERIYAAGDWADRLARVRRGLKRLAYPVAVFSTEDDFVSDLTEACGLEGIGIPEEVAILSVNNDDTLCLACGVPVSSIECNLRQLGYEAAALLDRHMKTPGMPREHHVLVHSPHVVSRRSTDALAVDHPGVAKALTFINKEFRNDLPISAVVKTAGMSRAGLFNAFQDELGRTPGSEITRLRLEAAKLQLAETDDSMDVIADDCGFRTSQNMYVVFRKHLGLGPSAFRKQSTTS